MNSQCHIILIITLSHHFKGSLHLPVDMMEAADHAVVAVASAGATVVHQEIVDKTVFAEQPQGQGWMCADMQEGVR